MKLGHYSSIIQPHPDILRRSRPSISSSDCCLVHGCTDTCVVVGRGEWGKSLLQYGYIMMCIDFWRQTAGPTVVTNAANVCRRLMRNGWWQCCTQVASLIGETLPSTVTSIIIICRKVDANTLCYRPPSPPLSWKSRHWYQRPYWMQWGRVVVLLRQRYVWRKGLHSRR